MNDIPTALKGHVQNVITTMPDSANGGAENYDTIELAFNKRFGSGFFLDSSYDYRAATRWRTIRPARVR